jgi:RHS repeat-associated protein
MDPDSDVSPRPWWWMRVVVLLVIATIVGTLSLPSVRAADHVPGAGSLGYTGEWNNPDTTLHLRARTYASHLGRFLQRDLYAGMQELPASLNRYSYTHNRPINLVDPTGLYGQQLYLDPGRVEAPGAQLRDEQRDLARAGQFMSHMPSPGAPFVLGVHARTEKPAPFQGVGVGTPLVRQPGRVIMDQIEQVGPLWLRAYVRGCSYEAGLLALGANEGRGTNFGILGGYGDLSLGTIGSEYVVGDRNLGIVFTSKVTPLRVHGFGGVLPGEFAGERKIERGASIFVAPGSVIMTVGVNIAGKHPHIFIEPMPKLEIAVTNPRRYPLGGTQGVFGVIGAGFGNAIGPEAAPPRPSYRPGTDYHSRPQQFDYPPPGVCAGGQCGP